MLGRPKSLGPHFGGHPQSRHHDEPPQGGDTRSRDLESEPTPEDSTTSGDRTQRKGPRVTPSGGFTDPKLTD